MSTAVREAPATTGGGHGGMPARRAVLRWAWRLFRREWRQQALVLGLLLVAVAGTTVGLGVAVNGLSEAAQFGTADHLITVGTLVEADQVRAAFGTADVIAQQKVTVPGSATGVDLRAQDPRGAYGKSVVRLDSGRFPRGGGEVAVTAGVARIFGLHVGGGWAADGRLRTVVGVVENPLNLRDDFALVAPGALTSPDRVVVLVRASQADVTAKSLPADATIESRGDDESAASAVVLLLTTVGLLFAGLLAVAGFTVMAQRRLRSLGMLGAIGASRRHVRLVLVANGAIVGAAGALAGAVIGVACWFAISPWLGPRIGLRIDPAHLPWPALLAAVVLATVTAVCAAWWPARVAVRVPVVAALSARPAPPRPAHRWAAAGAVLLVAGLGALVTARQTKPVSIVAGVIGTGLGRGSPCSGGSRGSRRLPGGWRCGICRGTGRGRARPSPPSRSPSASRPLSPSARVSPSRRPTRPRAATCRRISSSSGWRRAGHPGRSRR